MVASILAVGALLAAGSCASSHEPPTIPEDAVLVTHVLGERDVTARGDGGLAVPRPEIRIDLVDACLLAAMRWEEHDREPTLVVDGLVWETEGELWPRALGVVPYGCDEWLLRVYEGTPSEAPVEVTRASGYLRVVSRGILWSLTVSGDIAIELPHAPGHWRRAVIPERAVAAL